MALPLSKNQVRNLGKRLRDASAPAPEDLDLLAEVLTAYDEAMVTASDLLSGLGLPPSARLKNTGTVIEKLRRDHATHLHSIQDLAGLRVFVDDSGGRRRQDEVVALISSAFADRGMSVRVLDRRATPSRGYRAVHLVVTVDEVPVEIQVRTRAQHEWAEFFERMADYWGRDIRYPGGRPDVSWLVHGASGAAREVLEQQWQQVADQQLDGAVELADLLEQIECLEEKGMSRRETADLWERLQRIMNRTRTMMEQLMTGADQLESDS